MEEIIQIIQTIILIYLFFILPVQLTRTIKNKAKNKYMSLIIPGIYLVLLIILLVFPSEYIALDNLSDNPRQLLFPYFFLALMIDFGIIILKTVLFFYLFAEGIATLIAAMLPCKRKKERLENDGQEKITPDSHKQDTNIKQA